MQVEGLVVLQTVRTREEERLHLIRKRNRQQRQRHHHQLRRRRLRRQQGRLRQYGQSIAFFVRCPSQQPRGVRHAGIVMLGAIKTVSTIV